MRLTSAATLLACLSSCASASSIATGEAQAGQQPREDRTAAAGSSLPPGLGFLRALGGECRSCLKECLGTQATALQQASLRWQAPISLVTWRARTPPAPPSPLSPNKGRTARQVPLSQSPLQDVAARGCPRTGGIVATSPLCWRCGRRLLFLPWPLRHGLSISRRRRTWCHRSAEAART